MFTEADKKFVLEGIAKALRKTKECRRASRKEAIGFLFNCSRQELVQYTKYFSRLKEMSHATGDESKYIWQVFCAAARVLLKNYKGV